MPAWLQWTVKVGVTFAVALFCGVGLPLLLFRIFPAGGFQIIPLSRDFAVLIILVTAGSIYVSSLASSGVRALVLTLPIGVALELWIRMAANALRWGTSALAGWYMAAIVTGAAATRAVDPTDIITFTTRAFALTLAPLLLWFGFVNHTSSERSVRRIVVQGVSIALIIAAAIFAAGGLIVFHELRSR